MNYDDISKLVISPFLMLEMQIIENSNRKLSKDRREEVKRLFRIFREDVSANFERTMSRKRTRIIYPDENVNYYFFIIKQIIY